MTFWLVMKCVFASKKNKSHYLFGFVFKLLFLSGNLPSYYGLFALLGLVFNLIWSNLCRNHFNSVYLKPKWKLLTNHIKLDSNYFLIVCLIAMLNMIALGQHVDHLRAKPTEKILLWEQKWQQFLFFFALLPEWDISPFGGLSHRGKVIKLDE